MAFMIIVLALAVCGAILAFFAGRLPVKVIPTVVLLCLPALGILVRGFEFIGEHSELIGTGVFAFTVPVLAAYSVHALRRGGNRALTMAGLAGALVFGLLFLFLIAGFTYILFFEIL